MKVTIHYFLLILLVASLSSCQQRMYFPDRVNAPGLREGQELKVTVSVKPQSVTNNDSELRGNPLSFGADIAFSPVNHLGIFASYRSLNHRVIRERSNKSYDVYGGDFYGSRWEGGIGYFDNFGKVGKVEIYGGFGGGVINRHSERTPDRNYSDARYNRLFIQPAIGAGNQRYSVSGGFRLTYQKFTNFNSPDTGLRYDIMRYTNGRADVVGEGMGFIEPFVQGEVGWKYLKYSMQIGFCGQIWGGNIAGNLPMYVSMGLLFNIAPSYFGASERPAVNND